MTKKLTPIDAMARRRQLEDEKWAKIKAIALERGYAVVQISPRRYSVVKINGYGVFGSRENSSLPMEERDFFVRINGEQVFVGNYFDCENYIERVTIPLTPEQYTP